MVSRFDGLIYEPRRERRRALALVAGVALLGAGWLAVLFGLPALRRAPLIAVDPLDVVAIGAIGVVALSLIALRVHMSTPPRPAAFMVRRGISFVVVPWYRQQGAHAAWTLGMACFWVGFGWRGGAHRPSLPIAAAATAIAALAALSALLAGAGLARRLPRIELHPDGVRARYQHGRYEVPWDALPPHEPPRSSLTRTERLTLPIARPELVRVGGLARPHPARLLIPNGWFAVHPRFLADAIGYYADHPEDRTAIGTSSGHERLDRAITVPEMTA